MLPKTEKELELYLMLEEIKAEKYKLGKILDFGHPDSKQKAIDDYNKLKSKYLYLANSN